MKQLIILTLFTLFLYSCGDDTTTNNNQNPTGCTKSISLTNPSNDSILIQLNNVRLTWNKATCDPVGYKVELTHDSTFFNTYNTISVTDTTVYTAWTNNNGAWTYWRVKAFYGTPVNDSITSSSRKFRYQP